MFLICFLGYQFFLPIYTSEHIIVEYGLNPFDICIEQPIIWKYCKYLFVITYIFSSFFISNITFHLLSKNIPILFRSKKKNYKRKKEHKKETYSLITPKPVDNELKLFIR